jgi:hypothetical protein
MNIQKQAFLNEARKPEEKQRFYTSMPLWWLGMFGVISGSIGDILALGFATQSLVVASGGATVLLSNCVISSLWHREHQGVTALVGVFLIIGGSVIFAALSPPSKEYDLNDLEELAYHNPYFISYIALVIIVVSIALSLIATSSFYKKRHGMTLSIMSPVMKRMKVHCIICIPTLHNIIPTDTPPRLPSTHTTTPISTPSHPPSHPPHPPRALLPTCTHTIRTIHAAPVPAD